MTTDGDWLIDYAVTAAPKCVTAAQRDRIRALVEAGIPDGEIAPVVLLPGRVVGLVRLKMGARPGSGHAPADGRPRQLVSDERIARAYAGRRYNAPRG